MRLLKFCLGILLLLPCAAISQTLWELLRPISEHADALPMSTCWLLGGFLLWLLLYFCMPKPMRTYVLAHELTHALWAWALGFQVKSISVSEKGGSVQVSDTNWLVTLAPYFFPLYTVLVILIYGLIQLFTDISTYESFWMGLMGLSWSFHLCFTLSMLSTHQPDIAQEGKLFSYSVIYLFNVMGICIWLVILGAPELEETLKIFAQYISRDFHLLQELVFR